MFILYVLLLLTFLIILYAVSVRLTMPLEHRQISSHMPSITKTLWSEVLVALEISRKRSEDTMAFAMKMFEKNGPVFHANIAGRSFVFLNNPEDIKILLTSTQHINKSDEYKMMKPWLGEGLLTSSGEKWQYRRKLLTRIFHFKTLHMYNEQINRHSQVLVEKLLKACAVNGKIDITEHITLCSLDIICETIMGTEMNCQKGESVQYINSNKNACKSLNERFLKFWLWNDHIFQTSFTGRTFYKSIQVLQEYTNNVIKYKRKLLMSMSTNKNKVRGNENEKTQAKSLLDLLLKLSEEHPDQISIEDIQEEVDTFLFEGHDTTSVALTMIFTLLGLHPNVQDKVRDELFGIFGNSDRYTTMEDFSAMKYLEAVIKESLRMYPSVPVISRKLQNPLILSKYTIPPMATMVILPYVLHRSQELYPNPEDFIPDRFLNEENRSKFLFGYLPFSAGQRNCIGQKYAMNQLKTIVSTVLRKTRIEAMGTKEDIHMQAELIARQKSLPKMKFHQI